MLGTAPSGSVQLQDYCVRPKKNGEPFFKSLSEFLPSDPRRHAVAPVPTYSALSLEKSCLPPIIDFRLRDAQTCGCTRNFLFATLLRKGLFFKSLSACASDPRRRARSIHDRFPPQGRKNAPVITYSALILNDYSDIPYITVTVALVLCSRTAVVRPPIVPVPE